MRSNGGTSATSPRDESQHTADELDLAVALFERGYSDDRVSAAVKRCATLEEALKWLSPRGKSAARGSSAPAAASTQRGSAGGTAEEASAETLQQRRRIRKKTVNEKLSAKAESADAANVDQVAEQELEASEDTPQSSSGAGPVSTPKLSPRQSGASSLCESSREAISTVPCIAIASPGAEDDQSLLLSDNTAWWEDAAARWPAILDALRATLDVSEGFLEELPWTISSKSTASSSLPERSTAKRCNTWQSEEDAKRPCIDAIAIAPDDTCGVEVSDVPERDQMVDAVVAEGPARSIATEPSGTDALATPSVPGEHELVEPGLTTPGRRPPATPQPLGTGTASSTTRASPSRASMRRISTPGSAVRPNGCVETCEICCHDIPKNKAFRLSCGHGFYCASCVTRHAEARLQIGHATVPCPECNVNLPDRVLAQLLPKTLIESLQARSLEQAVSSVADLWACPTPNCPMRVALEENEQIPRLKCPECNKESCLRCGAQPYHKGLTCEEHAERVRAKMAAKGKRQRLERERLENELSLMKWIKDTGTKQCPQCKIAVSKQNLDNQATQYSECHKMLCRNCNTRFCFKCLAVLTDTYTCGCTRVDHGFVDPKTGKRLDHLRIPASKFAPKRKGKGKGKGRGR